MNIKEFCEQIITGSGGLHDYERCEMPMYKNERDIEIAIWTVRCLANPDCEGSDIAINAIIERRKLNRER